MDPARFHQLEDIFHRLLAVAEPERGRQLDARCGDDAELRREIVALLAGADAEADTAIGAIVGAAAGQLARDRQATEVGRRLGPYRLVSLLGAGGMGAVYLAARDDAEFAQKVAIKIILHATGSPQAIARFRDERQILAALDHPNIVRLLDGGSTDDDLPYLVMEHIEGQPITAYARSHALSVRARLELVGRVCAAIQYAHQHLIVHRDIKPSNILVDATGSPKLLDFGVATLLAPLAGFERQGATRTGVAPFTPEYASPEQARGDKVSTATDVYSLGAVLYELLTDQPPHRATGSLLEMIRVICEVDPVRPSLAAPPERRRELTGDLDNIVLKALQIDPARRYASIEQLADDLGRYLDGLPVLARTATVTYRARKFVRRNRAGVLATALIAGTLVAATIVARDQAQRADTAARRATIEATHAVAEAERAQREAERARKAELQVQRQLDQLEAAQAARARAETEVEAKRAEVTMSREQLEIALARAREDQRLADEGSARARAAEQRAQEAATAERKIRQDTQALYEREHARALQLEAQAKKITTRLR